MAILLGARVKNQNKDIIRLTQLIEKTIKLRARQCIEAGATKDRLLLDYIEIAKAIYQKRDDLSQQEKEQAYRALELNGNLVKYDIN